MNISTNVWEASEEEASVDVSKPTPEAYEKAKEEYKSFCSWASLARKRKNELLNELIVEHQNEQLYLKFAEERREIIRRYEVYNEIENGKKYFTPAEVKKMSASQVKENLTRICESTKYWDIKEDNT